MTSRYDMWIQFMVKRDETIMVIALFALLVTGNWISFNRWPLLRQWMIYGGVGVCIAFLILSGG